MNNSTITSAIEEITPGLAETMLVDNVVNRRPRPMLVAAYAEDMRRGLWRLTGEAVKISRTGMLLDGQHRLKAIAASGCTVKMLVVRGLDDAAQALMDQGAARTANDAVRMAGYQNATLTSTLARWMCLAPEVNPDLQLQLTGKASTAQILQTVEQHPDIVTAAQMHSSLRQHVPASPTPLVYSWLQMHRVDPADCERFYAGFINLTFEGLNDPRKAALRRLQAAERETVWRAGRDKPVAAVSTLARTWNAWRKGKEVTSLNAYSRQGGIIPPPKLV